MSEQYSSKYYKFVLSRELLIVILTVILNIAYTVTLYRLPSIFKYFTNHPLMSCFHIAVSAIGGLICFIYFIQMIKGFQSFNWYGSIITVGNLLHAYIFGFQIFIMLLLLQ